MKDKNSSPTSIPDFSKTYHNPICPQCTQCKAFIGYRNLEKLQKLRRRKSLTPCLELLQKQGVTGDTAIFVLSAVGGVK